MDRGVKPEKNCQGSQRKGTVLPDQLPQKGQCPLKWSFRFYHLKSALVIYFYVFNEKVTLKLSGLKQQKSLYYLISVG